MTAKKKKSLAMPPGKAPKTPEQLQAAKVAEALKAQKKAMEDLAKLYENVVNPKPHLDCRIFPLPDYCSVSSVAMRELDGHDDILSSYWADHNASAEVAGSSSAAMLADRREGLRLSLVAVEGAQVNEDGIPYMDCDSWTSRTWYHLMQCFVELNGVADTDVKNVQRGAISLAMRSPQMSASNLEEAQGDE